MFSRQGFGQEIREDGPQHHKKKRGTPTMGGTAIIIAMWAGYLVANLVRVVTGGGDGPTASGWLLLYLTTGMGLVGFLDDFIKIRKQRNLGLNKRMKFLGQTFIAVTFGVGGPVLPQLGRADPGVDLAVLHPGPGRSLARRGRVRRPVAGCWSSAWSNAVNFTDGLDGLAAGSSVMVLGTYVAIGFFQFRNACWTPLSDAAQAGCYKVRDPLDLAVVAAAALGGCIGFLWWNAHPARIIMGDTGSLALGGLIAGLSILTKTEMLLVVIAGLFVVEMLSVVIQIAVFKTRHVRVFKMAPFHHHFELSGWAETTVMVRFWLLAAMSAALGLGLFYAEWLSLTGVAEPCAELDRRGPTLPGVPATWCWPPASGVTGLPVVRYLAGAGAPVVVTADRAGARRAGADRRRRHLRRRPDEPPAGTDLVVTSAGIPPTEPAAGRGRGGRHRGDRRGRAGLAAGPGAAGAPRRWLVVTGTNGKTTTTGMLESILRAAGARDGLRQHRLAGAGGGAGRTPVGRAEPPAGRHRRRAVQLPAALGAGAAAARPGWCSTSPRTTWTGTGRWPPTPPAKARALTGEVALAVIDDPGAAGAAGRSRRRAGRAIRLGGRSPAALGVRRRDAGRPRLRRAAGELLAARRRSGRPARTTSPTRWPPPALALAVGVPAGAVGGGLRAFRPGGHRNVLVAERAGVRVRRRLQGHQPARRAGLAAGLPAGGVGRRRAAQGRVGGRAGAPRARIGWPGRCCSAWTRPMIARRTFPTRAGCPGSAVVPGEGR